MPKGNFLPSDFVATQFATAADKAAFGNTLLHFLESDCKQELFSKEFYRRLSMCFGHIAHCDRSGFYETWFSSDEKRLRFLQHTLRAHCYGQPEFTFSDVERAVQQAIKGLNLLVRFELRAAQSTYSAEIETLARLEAKYRAPVSGDLAPAQSLHCSVPCEEAPVSAPAVPVQASLF